MKFIIKGSKIADKLLCVFTVALALVMIFYSGYMILDSVYVNKNAFVSRELLAYRPDENKNSKESFEELQKINKDVTAWITVFDTKIDYPVLQGKDDLEYAMKDVYGKQSLSGSIYLSSSNKRDYSEDYNVIFGHHMVNGGMFGDLDKYENPNYFLRHRDGVLQTPYGNYDLKIFAFLRTDAYDNMVYYIGDANHNSIPQLLKYLEKNASNYIDVSNNDVKKVIALSTCADATTNGRAIVFATAVPRTAPIDNKGDDEDAVSAFSNIGELGHKYSEDNWALLNLVCVVLTLLTLIPILFTRKKYHQFKCSRNLIDKYEENTEYENLVKDLKHFVKKLRVGLILELAALIVAVVVFILTEDMTKPIVIRDEWTGIMILIFALSLLSDVICFRYRGERPPKNTETE